MIERDWAPRRLPQRRRARAGMAPPIPAATCANGSGTVQGRASALRRDRLPLRIGPRVSGEDLEPEAAGETDQGL